MVDQGKIESAKPFRILSLDGGGAKGFYSLGVLREIEGLIGKPLHEGFDLVFGTSTGAIIASLIGLGKSVAEIHDLYREHVPRIMQRKSAWQKSAALAELAEEIYGDAMFDSVKTGVGIVTTKWIIERPMIFKGSVAQAHGRQGTFVPGFGVRIGDAVQASCSAFPFFEKKIVHTAMGDDIELVDGGYCANNPTLYAIADAIRAMNVDPSDLRVVSVGVGTYPSPKARFFSTMRWAQYLQSVQLLQKTLEINTQSMDQLRAILFKNVTTVRINDTFERPEMATDLFEHNLTKLNILRQRGAESYANYENELKQIFEG
nr:patatin-like phospholipase family protein [Sinorhizobium medicae]